MELTKRQKKVLLDLVKKEIFERKSLAEMLESADRSIYSTEKQIEKARASAAPIQLFIEELKDLQKVVKKF